jgi:hypothetical protein
MENDEMVKFLEADFNQCFQQMRHYDCLNYEIIKFMASAYVALIGAGIGLYEFGITKGQDYTLVILITFAIAFLLGLFMYMSLIRNRVYYVHVTRYVNEIRKTFLDKKPLGFENKSKMYTNCQQPPFFNWRSSQAYIIYVTATINGCLFGTILYVLFCNSAYKWCCAIGSTSILIVLQLTIGIIYLITRNNKSASQSVFGKE